MENINAVTKIVLANLVFDIEVSEHWELSAAGSWAGIVAEPMLGDRREDVLKDLVFGQRYLWCYRSWSSIASASRCFYSPCCCWPYDSVYSMAPE